MCVAAPGRRMGPSSSELQVLRGRAGSSGRFFRLSGSPCPTAARILLQRPPWLGLGSGPETPSRPGLPGQGQGRAGCTAPSRWPAVPAVSPHPSGTRGGRDLRAAGIPGMVLGLRAETWAPDPPAVLPGASRCPLVATRFRAGHRQGPRRLSQPPGPADSPWGRALTSPSLPQQVTKAHEPPREDPVPPAPATPQHLQPESSAPQAGSSPRGRSRSPVPPAEKEGERPCGWGVLGGGAGGRR